MNDLKDIVLEESGWEEVGVLVSDDNGKPLHYLEDQIKLKVLAGFNDEDIEHSYFGYYRGTAEENTKCASFINKLDDDSFWECLDDFYKRADAILKGLSKNDFHKKELENKYSNLLYLLSNTFEGKLLLEEYGEKATYFNFDITRSDILYFDYEVEEPNVKDGVTLIMKTIERKPKASLEERKKIAKECFDREIKRAQGEYAKAAKLSYKEYENVIKVIEESSYNEYYVISLCYENPKLLKENMIIKSLKDFTYENYYRCNSREVYYKIIKE